MIASKAFSSARNLDPCAPRFGGLRIPVLRPGLAWRSTLPPAAPLPSTPSATAHTLSPRAITALFGCFIGTTSASDSSSVPRQIALLACCRGPGSPQRLRTRRRSPRFRRDPFARDGVFDHGRASTPRIAAPHILPSATVTASASTDFGFSRLNSPPHAIAVYASRRSSPSAPQHSLPSARYGLLGPDFHRLDRASFAWRTAARRNCADL